MFFGLYDQFSDTPDEALWTIKLLNKIEPDIFKHFKIFEILNSNDRKKEAIQEYEQIIEKYSDKINEIDKFISAYILEKS